VGEDQKQHLELTRELAQRFNRRFGPTFKVPEPIIAPIGARIMDLEDPRQKMSKSSSSKQGTIWLTDSPEDIRAKIRHAVTDSGREIQYGPEKPAVSNLMVIYSIATGSSLADAETAFRGKGYAPFKQAVSDALVEYLRPVRERYQQVNSQPEEIIRILQRGAKRAAMIAAQTMTSVYDRIGLLPP
jgi:tryptophanyl-tRNA synthetase